MDINAKGTGTILDASGIPQTMPTLELSLEDVKLLREYKKLLRKHGLREALYCNTCFDGSLSDGCEAHVTDGDVLIKCRHLMRWYKGQTF